MVNLIPNSADSSPLDEYVAIEAAYRSGDWATVIEQGPAFNRKLARAGGASAKALRQRLELMLAHTHLYGYGDADAAQRHYQALLNQPVETSLRQMAEDGLKQCRERILATAGDRAPFQAAAETTQAHEPQPPAAAEADRNSAPWLNSMPGSAVTATAQAATTAAAPWLPDLNAKPSAPRNASPQPAAPAGQTSDLVDHLNAGSATAENAGDRSETLIPDVIEEPELIKVHQSDPRLADEVELLEPSALQPSEMEALVEAAETEQIAASGLQETTSPAADEPDPDADLLGCLRLVRLP